MLLLWLQKARVLRNTALFIKTGSGWLAGYVGW